MAPKLGQFELGCQVETDVGFYPCWFGWNLTKHLSINAGYRLGSRLVVSNNASSDRVGLRLTQKGALAGAEFSF